MQHLDELTASASIVFDNNEPIDTTNVLNHKEDSIESKLDHKYDNYNYNVIIEG